MRKIRIIYVQHTCKYDGSTIALKTIVDELTEACLIEAFVVYATDGDFKKWLDERNIPNRKIGFHFNAYPKIVSFKSCIAFIPRLLKILYTNYKAKKELRVIVDDFQPDLIHTNIGPVKFGFDVAKEKRIPHVWHIREYQQLDFGIRFFPSFNHFKKLIRKSNLICITQTLYNYFNMGENARVIYDGVMDETESQFIIPKEKYFLFVGRLEEAKGALGLVKTFCEFAKQNVDYKLLLAGTGSEKQVSLINDVINKAHLTERIELLGFRSDRYDLMAKATALIVPSRNEGFGFITAEAMFSGCLVIGNNMAGTKEIIENSDGNAIAYRGEEALLKAMVEVVENGIELYYDKIKRAQKIALASYSKSRYADEVFKFYQDIK